MGGAALKSGARVADESLCVLLVEACVRRLLIVLVVVAVAAFALWRYGRPLIRAAGYWLGGRPTLEQRLDEVGEATRARLRPAFDAAAVAYPPGELRLLALKDERRLEVFARDSGGGPWRAITSWPILGASGGPGPKLTEGDRQVPEGEYGIESLNPASRHHLALRVAYPSPDDLARAAADGRTRLGHDIMIHGGDSSAGCIAIGDEAVTELFVLVADVGVARTRLLIAPVDFRVRDLTPPATPAWIAGRYQQLRDALRELD